jgi:peptide/nickel transport system permease protein
MAAYFGGFLDSVVSRGMDLLLAFPILLFTLTLTPILQSRLGQHVPWQGQHVAHRVADHDPRLLRLALLSPNSPRAGAQPAGAGVRRVGARHRVVVRAHHHEGNHPERHGVVLVYATLAIPTNITAEAALSFLGVGVRDPTPSWGQMLNQSQSNNWYQLDPWFMLVPGITLLLTVMAFNLLGDAVATPLIPGRAAASNFWLSSVHRGTHKALRSPQKGHE